MLTAGSSGSIWTSAVNGGADVLLCQWWLGWALLWGLPNHYPHKVRKGFAQVQVMSWALDPAPHLRNCSFVSFGLMINEPLAAAACPGGLCPTPGRRQPRSCCLTAALGWSPGPAPTGNAPPQRLQFRVPGGRQGTGGGRGSATAAMPSRVGGGGQRSLGRADPHTVSHRSRWPGRANEPACN